MRGKMTKFIAVTNRRGGVGKTTTTLMLAYGMAVYARKSVLVVDLDAQASTSTVLMGPELWNEARKKNRTVGDLVLEVYGSGPVDMTPYVSDVVGDVHVNPGQIRPKIQAIPASFTLDERELEFVYQYARQFTVLPKMYSAIRERIAEIFRSLEGQHDIVIFDCPPGLSNVSWGALRASDYAILPYIPDRTAEDNISWLLSRLKKNNPKQEQRVLANRYQVKSPMMQGVAASISQEFPSLGLVIPMQSALSNALEYEENTQTINQKFGTSISSVKGLYNASLEWIYEPSAVGQVA